LATIEISGQSIKSVQPQKSLLSHVAEAKILREAPETVPNASIWDAESSLILPAMVDMHIHSRDPGFPEKETWESLTAAAYAGGVVAVADMPNTKPATMTISEVREKIARATQAGIEARVYLGVGASNISSLAQTLAVADSGICGVKIYYGHSTGNLMFSDLEELHRALPSSGNLLLSFHSEDQCRIDMHYSKISETDLERSDNVVFRKHSEIRDSKAAITSTRLILDWAKKHRRSIHIAHVSTPDEVELISEYRKSGLAVTSEVAPHHLLLCEDDYEQLGAYLKVNPPVRSRQEVERLKRLFQAGEIDAVATDHAPHTIAEKQQNLRLAPSGLPSIEYFVPLLFKIGRILGMSTSRLIDFGSRSPAQLLGLEKLGRIAPGYDASFIQVIDASWVVTEASIKSKCGWTPYLGFEFPVFVEGTWHRSKRVFSRSQSLTPVCT
jgi:dihydroorotase